MLPWLEAPLRHALSQQRGHALLVQAPDGVGALQFMHRLALAWLCEASAPERPCGQCTSCRLVTAETHPDARLVLPEAMRVALGLTLGGDDDAGDGAKGRRKPSRQIRIDEVRAAVDWIVQTASRAQVKALVLHPAEAMNQQAASALLKTLEEPPGPARLLLGTADAARLLPTLRSRCQRIHLAAPPAEQACAWLEAQGVADAAALLAGAGGAPLDALVLATLCRGGDGWSALPQAIAEGRASAFAGWPVARAVDTLQKICHDLLVQRSGGQPRYFNAQALPAGAALQPLLAWARSLSRIARHDEHPWNEPLLLEALVSEGRGCWQEGTLRATASRRPLATLGR